MSTITRSGVALLVGAGDAIGAAVARRFAAGGYSVCIARRDAEKSRSVVQEIVASGGLARRLPQDAVDRVTREPGDQRFTAIPILARRLQSR